MVSALSQRSDAAVDFNCLIPISSVISPAGEPLTESCFLKQPLNFTGMPSLRYADGKQTYFNGRCTSEGTNPPGSTW